jgi:hypothetical protein
MGAENTDGTFPRSCKRRVSSLRSGSLCAKSYNSKGRPNHAKWKAEALTNWFLSRWPSVYPTETEKEEISRRLRMTKKQVDLWFINGW